MGNRGQTIGPGPPPGGSGIDTGRLRQGILRGDGAWPNGRTIGQLLVTFEWSDWRNGVFWWLQSVYVHKEWRRRGVFKTLYDYVLRKAECQGNVAGIRLYVEQDNAVAQGVYAHVGLAAAPYKVFETDFILPTRSSE